MCSQPISLLSVVAEGLGCVYSPFGDFNSRLSACKVLIL